MNSSILKDLRLEILLSGKGFDGNLNFGTVILEHKGKKYPLDITDSTGYLGETIPGLSGFEYLIVCEFESDYEETEAMFNGFEEDYCFDLTEEILIDTETKGTINLHRPDEDKTSNINIGRVSTMVITCKSNPSINIPVKQSFDM